MEFLWKFNCSLIEKGYVHLKKILFQELLSYLTLEDNLTTKKWKFLKYQFPFSIFFKKKLSISVLKFNS